ncbi:MAG TPA: hypothetical protein VHP33_18060 [Polyangiaceae bacterium]|nr:hypothetical protein [Polyangiaceae bacterium]
MTAYAARLEKVRRLAETDVVSGELEPEARRAVAQLWARRAEGELSAATTFSGLHRDCVALGSSATITQLTARAVSDEHFHVALSLMMAEHYQGEPAPSPVPRADAWRFESCGPDVAPALRFLLHCALNETIAVAYLRQCLREAKSVLIQAALRELLHDEIAHSRVGWAQIAAVAGRPAIRASLCRELPALLVLVSNAWCEPMKGSGCPPGHGGLSESGTRAVTEETLQTLVLPGLMRFGIEPHRAAG